MWRHGIWASLAAGLVVAGAGPGRADDSATARQFVERLYGAYRGDGPDYLGRQAARVFSPRLRALLRRDRELTPKGEVGALDGDPICDCQDFEISRVSVTAEAVRPHRARATAHFLNAGRRTTVRFDLVATADGWRIDNIHSPSTPDLAAYLRRHAGGR